MTRGTPARYLPRSLHSVLLTALALACGGESTAPAPAPETTAAASADSTPQQLAGEFSTPESVLYDAEQDVYFVSNINGSPGAADDNGYISRLPAGGGEPASRWIDGASADVQLDAPKGMALVGGELWVADLHSVRRFDRHTGTPAGVIEVADSVFLNDLSAASPSGPVYVSDTAIAIENDAVRNTGSDAVFEVSADGSAMKIASSTELHQPNGIFAGASGLWGVGFGAKQLYRIADGAVQPSAELPGSQLDGLIELPDGSLLISSWEARGIFRGPPAGPFELAVPDIEAPADIGFDSQRQLLLVPHFTENRVTTHPIALR